MKKIYTFISIAAAALCLLPSCETISEDSVFTEYDSIVISEEMRTNPLGQTYCAFVFVSGDEVVIPAKYEIKDQTLTDADLGFEWYYGNEVVSTEKSVKLGKVPAGRYSGLLVITNRRDNSKYSKEFNFQVNASAYEDGWAVITDDGTNSHVNYITANPETGDYILVEDVLFGASGITLPTGMTDMEYHMYNIYPQVFAVALAGPGKESSIELQFNNMEVLGNFAKEFVGDIGGKGFTDIEVFEDFVAATTTDGDFFIREEGGSAWSRIPHASFFPNRPVVIDGGLKVNHIASFSPIGNNMAGCSLSFAHDDLNGRALIMGGGAVEALNEDYYDEGIFEAHRNGPGFDGVNYYEDITFPDPWTLSDYNVLWMGGAGCSMDFMADTKVWSIVYFLEHKQTGKRYVYAYDYNDTWGMSGLNLDLFFPFPEDISIDPATMASCCMVGGSNNYIFFTANSNKEVYALNALNGTLKKVYTAASPVSGMVLGKIGDMMESFGGTPTLYDERLVIGLEDGTILVIEMNDSVIYGTAPNVIKQFKSTTGKMTLGVFNPASSMLS